MNTFSIGDEVTWTSQSKGIVRIKRGIIVGLVPPRTMPKRAEYRFATNDVRGFMGRRDVSYIVRVGKRDYWPWAINLKVASAVSPDDSKSQPTPPHSVSPNATPHS